MARYRPWHPIIVQSSKDAKNPLGASEITATQARCLQLVSQGKAGPDEQKMALEAIYVICGADDLEFLPDEHGGDRETAFKSGKRFVGLQLRKIVSFPLTLLTGET